MKWAIQTREIVLTLIQGRKKIYSVIVSYLWECKEFFIHEFYEQKMVLRTEQRCVEGRAGEGPKFLEAEELALYSYASILRIEKVCFCRLLK